MRRLPLVARSCPGARRRLAARPGAAALRARPSEACRRRSRPSRTCWPAPPRSSTGPQQSRSIVLFDEIIDAPRGAAAPGQRCPRAAGTSWSRPTSCARRAYFNIGLQEKASDNFRSLVQLKPEYTLSKEKVSPKVVDFFNSVKKALVGYLAVSSKPGGGQGHARRRRVIAAELGLTDFFPAGGPGRRVHGGGRARGLSRPRRGRSASPPRPRRPCRSSSTRTLASAFVITEPAGVEVWIDGELRDDHLRHARPRSSWSWRAGKGLDPRAPRPAPSSATSPSARTSSSCGSKCYETVKRTDRDPERPGLRHSTASSSRTRWARCSSPPTRPGGASS